MWQYILRRTLLMFPTLLGAALLVFILMNIVPGDIVLLVIGHIATRWAFEHYLNGVPVE